MGILGLISNRCVSAMSFLNIRGTENCISFHPGAHGANYYGDGTGRDVSLARSWNQIHGTSDGMFSGGSHDMGSPRMAPPKEGRPTGYKGHVPGFRYSLGKGLNDATASAEDFNSPRGVQDLNEDKLRQFSLTSRSYGEGVELENDSRTVVDYTMHDWKSTTTQAVPELKLSDSAGKSLMEIQAENLLAQDPPRAVTQRSARLRPRTAGRLSDGQIELVQSIVRAENEYSVIHNENEVLLHLPSLAQRLSIPEERIRSTLLSLPGCHIRGCGQLTARQTSGQSVAVPASVWEQATNS